MYGIRNQKLICICHFYLNGKIGTYKYRSVWNIDLKIVVYCVDGVE